MRRIERNERGTKRNSVNKEPTTFTFRKIESTKLVETFNHQLT